MAELNVTVGLLDNSAFHRLHDDVGGLGPAGALGPATGVPGRAGLEPGSWRLP